MTYIRSENFMDLTKNKNASIEPSPSRTTREREIAQFISDSVNEDKEFLKEINLLKVNFDVQETKNGVYIKCIYLVQENGEAVPVPYNRLIKKPKVKRSYFTSRKVGALFMPMGIPTFFQSYAKEMEAVVEQNKFKYWVTAVITAITALLGVELTFLISGLFVIALADLIVSLIPGNIKPGTEKDHCMQSKLWAFVTNFLSLIGVVAGCDFLTRFVGDNGFFGMVTGNLYYPISAWIFGVYVYRLVGYAARANNTKVPQSIKKLFDKDISS